MDNYRWGPITSKEKVPALVDQASSSYSDEAFPGFLNQGILDELEEEFRAQIEAVLAAALKPAHLDWHSLNLDNRADIFDLMLRLAKEYKLAFRITGQPFIQKVHSPALPRYQSTGAGLLPGKL